MTWLSFAILAPVIYTIVNFVDKYLVEKELKDYRGLPVFTGITGFFAGTLLYIINGFPILSLIDTLLTLLSGALLLWGLVTYFKALTISSTSEVVILMKLIPIIVLFLSVILLNQPLDLSQIIGFVIILISTTLLSLKRIDKKIKLSKSLYLMFITSALWALSYIIFAFVSESNAFNKTISFESWGTVIGALLLYFFSNDVRIGFQVSLNYIRKKGLLIIFINEGLFVIAKYFTFLAISLGPVALVSVLEGMQVFYAIIIGFILTSFNPKVFKEERDNSLIIKKTIIATFIFLGIWLIS